MELFINPRGLNAPPHPEQLLMARRMTMSALWKLAQSQTLQVMNDA